MNEDLTPRMQQNMQRLSRYLTALESGDSETLLIMLQEAERDLALERMILEVNTMYQLADGESIAPNEVRDAQQFLHFYLLSDQSVDTARLAMTLENEQMNGTHCKDTLPFPLTQQKSARERIDRDMETISSTKAQATSSTFLPENKRDRKRPPTNTRLRRLGGFVQMLAAVLVVVALIAGFAFIAVFHFKAQVGSSDSGGVKGSWRLVSNPNPGATDNQFQGVVALSANDAWAVGSYDNQFGGRSYTLIEHWNGKQWQVIQSPNPGSVFNDLTGVAAIAPDNIWAVGGFSNTVSDSRFVAGGALVEHWNGKQWSVVQNAPRLDSVYLQGITALSANDIWAVGSNGFSTFTEHWNGTKWGVVPGPNTGESTNTLMGVKVLSANDVWAAGFAEGHTTSSGHSQVVQRTLTEHWDGTKWSIVPGPNSSCVQCMLYGMTALSQNDVWAVGISLDISTDTGKALLEHWDGTHWNVISSPDAGASNVLMQVTAISANNVWAVGYSYATKKDWSDGVARTLTEHWDGTKWSVIASPNPKPMSNEIASPGHEAQDMNDMWAVAGVPGSNQVWAVGSQTGATSLSFIERFS